MNAFTRMLVIWFFCWQPAHALLTTHDIVARDDVDLIEVNHYYDESGKHVFDQLIFYDWSREESRYHVRAWRLIKHSSQYPLHDLGTDQYVVTWQDNEILRTVTADSFRESWTQYDPELLERANLPKSRRRELIGVRPEDDEDCPLPPSP